MSYTQIVAFTLMLLNVIFYPLTNWTLAITHDKLCYPVDLVLTKQPYSAVQ